MVRFDVSAVQNERQPRNTATIRPEAFRDMEQGRALREAAVAVGVFGYVVHYCFYFPYLTEFFGRIVICGHFQNANAAVAIALWTRIINSSKWVTL